MYVPAHFWFSGNEKDFDIEMMKGEVLFLKSPGNLPSTIKFWNKLIEREGLTQILEETPDLTLESYKKFTINIPEAKVTTYYKNH